MTARHVTLAQRLSPDRLGPRRLTADCLTWSDLGCPKQIGLYDIDGVEIRVKRVHIVAAEDDPDALFTVVTFRPPLGPPEYMLGHRIA